MIQIFFCFAFLVGERLEYVAKYGFLNIGKMTLEIRDTLSYQDVDCYYFRSILTSSGALNLVFTLHDTIEVYADQKNLLPLFYEGRIHEGKYHNHSRVIYDNDRHLVLYDDTLAIPILEESRDLLTFWYRLRTVPLVVGDTIDLNIHTGKENYRVACSVVRKERLKTCLGEFNTILVEPRTEEKGMFSEGGMQIWYSDDEYRFPVQIRTRIKAGTVLFKLQGVKG